MPLDVVTGLSVASMLALGGRHRVLTWPVVLLAVMPGELAYGNPIDGFLGAVTVFGCLLYVIFDE